MKKMSQILVAAVCSVSLATAAEKKVGWSLGYYVSWDHSYSPATLPWDAVTHMSNFQVTINGDATLGLPDENVAKQLIAEGHKRGKKVIFSIGGGGYGQQFANATTNANRARFISRLMDYLRKLGYDGIDTDWEGNEVESQFVAFHKDLRDSINAQDPKLCITIAAEDWNPIAAKIHMYVDQINDMWYGAKADKYPGYLQTFINLGVPKSKLAPGIGISPDQGSGNIGVQASVDLCEMVVNQGFGGIMLWCIQTKGFVPADLAAITPYVPAATTSIATGNRPLMRSDVKLGIFDLRGRLIGNLIGGTAEGDRGLRANPYARTDAAGMFLIHAQTEDGIRSGKKVISR
jgi:GH18 family chitinase